MKFVELLFSKVSDLKIKTPGTGFDNDYDHAVEEWFEICKAKRVYRGAFRRDRKLKNEETLRAYRQAKAHLREEVLDLVICCVAMFISLGGDFVEFEETIARKLGKWEQSLKHPGGDRGGDPVVF